MKDSVQHLGKHQLTLMLTMTNKKRIIFTFILIIIMPSICLYINNNSFSNSIKTYKHNSIELDCNSFVKPFKYKKTITIENNTSDVKVYSLKWQYIENTLEYQEKFLYEIKCEGNNCKDISPSQIPIFDFTLFKDIYIEMHSKQKYTITFSYKGNKDEYGYFKGKLIADEEITNKEQYENYMKEREQKIKNMDKVMKEYQKLDDK